MIRLAQALRYELVFKRPAAVVFRSTINRITIMLSWSIIFLVVAIIAGILGFGALSGLAQTIAWVCFVLFLIMFVVSLIRGRKPI